MPLPDAAQREELHVRKVECRGFRRADGLYDIDARITDVRSWEHVHRTGRQVPAFTHLHDMWIRLTIDVEMVVQDIVAVTDASPHSYCGDATAAMQRLKGLRISSGWARRTRELLGGAQGCTHLMELLGPAATTAYQTLVRERRSRPERLNAEGRPVTIDSCYAYGSDKPAVKQLWPAFYTGPADEEPA